MNDKTALGCIFNEINTSNGYEFPSKNLLKKYGSFEAGSVSPESDSDAEIIIEVLKNNGTSAWIEEIKQGPTFRQYKIGFKHRMLRSSVFKQNEDFAQNLCVSSVRIIPPGQDNSFIKIEVPNRKRFTIGFDRMVDSVLASRANIPMALGMDVSGDSIVIDVTQMHDMLLLGDSGSGKTISIHSLLNSILYSRTPNQVRILMADLGDRELQVYNGILHLISTVMTKPEVVLKAMEELCCEMERRMILFRDSGTKSILTYNEEAEKTNVAKLPYLLFIIDEFAPLMIEFGKQFEYWIKRISAVARFCGIHLVLATKHINKDVVTSVISSNISTVIAFRIKDDIGLSALKYLDVANLLGRGDLLFSGLYSSTVTRIQGPFIEPEVNEIVEFLKGKV